MSIAFESALTLAKMLRGKEVSSRELTDYFVRRIERFDDNVNAVVVRDFERARKAADEADSALARSEVLGPLHGLPMTIKEAYDIAGLPTTVGVPELKDNIAKRDAPIVTKLKMAGAHLMGKTNMPVRGIDHQSYNEIYGTTNNPWNVERTPGGSSGGSAAALAAGLTPIECAADNAGSIRDPAHFCGVYGHKPTWGTVPRGRPEISAPQDLHVYGPMARHAQDLAALMDIITGSEPLNQRGWQLVLPRPTKSSLSEYRVALWPDEKQTSVSVDISNRIQAIGDRLASLGAVVSDSARPAIDIEESWRIYLYMLRGSTAANIPDDTFAKLQKTAEEFGANDLSDEAVQARGAVQDHRHWLRLNNDRERLRLAWRSFFDDWDILICPATVTTAFPHDHSPKESRTVSVNGKKQPYIRLLYWAGIITVAYLPSTVFPAGLSGEGLPIGVQAVGAEYSDYVCIDFARLMADEIGGFAAPPGYTD